MRTEEAIQEFILSRGTLRPHSIKTYEKDLALFQHIFPEDLPMMPQPIQAFFNSQRRQNGEGPLTPETVHRRFRSVRAMYRQVWFWHQDELKDKPNPIPLVRVPKPKQKPHRYWTQRELYSFFLLDLELRDRALLALFCDTGSRADECAHVTWDAITPEFITLSGKSGTRTVPLSDTTYNLFRELKASYGDSPGRYVFKSRSGEHITYWGLYHLVRRLCRRAGLTGQRLSPHTFRHSFGTLYAASPACDPKVLQAVMGHKYYQTTLGYIQNNVERMARNHQHCTPLKDLASAAQHSFFDKTSVLKEAEAILEGGDAI